jgi:hypothetical protein
MPNTPHRKDAFWPSSRLVRLGAVAGLIGGVCIWIYEAVVWVGIQGMMPFGAIPANATGLVFGTAIQKSLGMSASILGLAIHFLFASLWGALLALILPIFLRRGYEATLVALFYAVFAWIVMHAAIAAISTSHPDYLDPVVVIGGFMSHFFFTVPMALFIKRAVLRRSQL